MQKSICSLICNKFIMKHLNKYQKSDISNRNTLQLKTETRVSFNKDSGDTVSMNDVNNKCENGIEASNETAEAALTATMDEFRREGIVMLSKMEENG